MNHHFNCSTYPSVYVGLTGVFASDRCTRTINGIEISATTVAFPVDGLSTARFYSTKPFPDAHYRAPPVAGYHAIDFREYTSCSAARDSIRGLTSSIIITSTIRGTVQTWDLCFPFIMVPSQMQEFHPAWASCTLEVYPLPDPPRALTPVSALDGASAEATLPLAPIAAAASTTMHQVSTQSQLVVPGATPDPPTDPKPSSRGSGDLITKLLEYCSAQRC